MSYDYAVERPKIFTEDGVKLLTVIRDYVKATIKTAGAVSWGKVCDHATKKIGATDSWEVAACLDYLVEQGEICILNPSDWMQDLIYTNIKY